MSTGSLKFAIAGAGVSGLYTAWRLAGAGVDPETIAVYEISDRVGGRLWSVAMKDEKSIPAELGGMFFNDHQPLVFGLCDRVLGLAHEPVSPAPDFAWLRSVRFKVAGFADPAILPYRLAGDEQGLTYYELLQLATDRIAPGLDRLWPRNPGGRREQTIGYLRELDFDGRPLYQWGFWNLLARVISNEAWQALRGIVSSYTLFENWNGYDAMISLVVEQAGTWHRLSHGYQKLPERLAADLEQAGVDIFRGHRLQRVERHDTQRGGMTLELKTQDDLHRVDSENLVLAWPRHALAELVAASPGLRGSGLENRLDSVRSIPACKIFLTFDSPWWQDVPDGPGRIGRDHYAVSHTDLPLRQCYYLGVDPASGEGLMLASYADGDAVGFWRALMDDSGRGRQLKSGLGTRARDEIRRQLSEMHGVDVPRPSSGLFVDWTVPPFGGGWHNWKTGWMSWRATEAMRKPIDDCNLFVCGEAYSASQGWTEGALETAEFLVQQEFGLDPPGWLDRADDCLAAYRQGRRR